MTKDKSGPAFPLDSTVPCKCGLTLARTGNYGHGMSLRKWFGGLAMARMANDYVGHPDRTKMIAKEAYEQADAMIAEGEKND